MTCKPSACTGEARRLTLAPVGKVLATVHSERHHMIRAFTTLIGLACAAALLLLVPDTGSAEGGGLWKRAALLAAAGLVAGAFYQLGGIRRTGVRLNLPFLIGAFLPWTLLAIAICAQRSGTPSTLTRWVRDILPDSALTRWSGSFPILAFTSGVLLALALVEPLVQAQVREITAVKDVEEPVRDHVQEPVDEPAEGPPPALAERERV
jgi:hypothetical protein